MAHAELARVTLEIGATLGADRVRRPIGDEANFAQAIAEPRSAGEIGELVRKCESDRITLAPMGRGRTLNLMRTHPVDVAISLVRMDRVIAHEPGDMTITVEAGVTLANANSQMSERGQRLPIDPPNPERATIGSLIGAARSGSLRLSEGVVRDLLIGIQFVGHGGRIVRAGGRVVKNVAGYDLMKVMTGSFGTLGIITEATFKVRPRPESYELAAKSYDEARAPFAAATRLHDEFALAHVEILSPAAAREMGRAGKFALLAGISGTAAEVADQHAAILKSLGDGAEIVAGPEAQQSYERLRDLQFGSAALAAQMAVLPAELGRCIEESGAEFCAHVGSGVATLASIGELDASRAAELLARWRQAAHDARGHVRVLSAARSIRRAIDIFDRPNPGAFAIMRRLKAAFDPMGIFNPGCFVGGL